MRRSTLKRSWLAGGVALVCVTAMLTAAQAQERITTSPWEHRLWRNSSPAMLNYICKFSRQPASWCPEAMRQQQVNPETAAEMFGPQLTADDARWLRLVASADLNNLSARDAVFIKQRAEQLRDPQAMEALGYLYAQGIHLQKDLAQAYLWYGRAFLAGERHVKPNMDLLWKQINENDHSEAAELVRIFRAEARVGQSPAESTDLDAAAASEQAAAE